MNNHFVNIRNTLNPSRQTKEALALIPAKLKPESKLQSFPLTNELQVLNVIRARETKQSSGLE